MPPHPNRLIAASVAVLLAALCPQARAVSPVITGELTIIENRPPDDIFGLPGLNLTLRVDATHGNGIAALTTPPANATATSNNNNYPFTTPTPLPALVPTSANGGYFITLIPITAADFPNISGRYNYIVTDNTGQNDHQQSHTLNRMEVIPLPTNLMVSDNTTHPTFSFTDPDPTPNVSGLVRYYQVWIIDSALNGIALIDAPGSTPVIPIPAGIMCPCAQYHLRAQSGDADTSDSAAENLATAFLSFSPIPTSPTGDMNKDCRTNGQDIQWFVNALVAGSTTTSDLCPGDFNGSGAIDVGDIPAFIARLLGN